MGGCRQIAGLFGGYIYGDLTPDEMREVRLHLDECPGCRTELEAQTRTVELIPRDRPSLSDEERQQVMWTVKGALRSLRLVAPFRFSPGVAQGFAVAALLIAAFAAGTMLGMRGKPAAQTVVVKPEPVDIEHRALPPPNSGATTADRSAGPAITVPSAPRHVTTAAGPRRRDRIAPVWRGHLGPRRAPGPKLSPAAGTPEGTERGPEPLKTDSPGEALPNLQTPAAPPLERPSERGDRAAPDRGPILTPPKTQPVKIPG